MQADVPYLDQWFGIWAMHDERFWAEFHEAKKLQLHVHMDSDQPAKAQAAARAADFTRAGDIAVIEFNGKLMKHASSFGGGTSTVRARRQIRAAAASADIAGIMLHMDSPGGIVAGTAELADDIAAAAKQKPVHGFIADMGASAMYWAASQVQRLSVNRTGIVGSIGTYGVVYDYSELAAKEGIKAYVIRAGKFKGMATPGTVISDEELAEMQNTVDSLNEQFLAGVARGRKMAIKAVRELADGAVYVGQQALTKGLVDAVESFDAAFSQLQKETRRRTKMTVAITPDVTADDSQAQAAAGQAGGQVDSVVQPTASQPAKPAAATADQIESTCKGASAEFVLAQLKAGATIEAAKDAWIGELAQQLAARPKENKPAAHSPGVAPVGGTAAAGSAAAGNAAGGDAIAMWNEAIADKMKAGMNKQRATRAVIAENAELHTEYLRAYNELHGRKKAAALL